jgi:hypothetical protein
MFILGAGPNVLIQSEDDAIKYSPVKSAAYIVAQFLVELNSVFITYNKQFSYKALHCDV